MLIPNITKVPDISNQTSMQDVSKSFQLEYDSIGTAILDKAERKISTLNTSRLLNVNVDVKASRVRRLTKVADRLLKKLPII